MPRNVKLFWKFATLAAMIPLIAAIVAGLALRGTATVKYEFDNLYGFMLIPISRFRQKSAATRAPSRRPFRHTEGL